MVTGSGEGQTELKECRNCFCVAFSPNHYDEGIKVQIKSSINIGWFDYENWTDLLSFKLWNSFNRIAQTRTVPKNEATLTFFQLHKPEDCEALKTAAEDYKHEITLGHQASRHIPIVSIRNYNYELLFILFPSH